MSNNTKNAYENSTPPVLNALINYGTPKNKPTNAATEIDKNRLIFNLKRSE